MEVERSNTRGIAGAGLGLGIAGTALGVLNGGLGNVLGNNGWGTGWNGGWNGGCAPVGVCSESQLVNRYELGQERKIAELQSAIALRDANTYGDQKLLEVYKYIDGELKSIRATLCEQAVTNQRTAGSFALASADLAAVKAELTGKINLEAERRCCADNAIVNYANATFYPKMVADVTVGTTTTAQTLYNPIPDCGCCGK
jgi:hypothetical protein